MKAARLYAVNDHRVESVGDPLCREGQVLVRVLASGICGSDLPRILKTGVTWMNSKPAWITGGGT